MLCLGRREGESITIGSGQEAIVVQVARVSGGRVTLAIEAPDHVRVLRTELVEEETGLWAEH